jgi:hypothetical protein
LFPRNLICTFKYSLYRGYPKKAIASSISLAIIVLFYSLTTASYFRPDVYRFEDRITYHQYFDDQYILSKAADNLVINVSLLIWLFFSLVGRFSYFILFSFTVLILLGVMGFSSSVNELISIISLPLILSIHIIDKKTSIQIIQTKSSQLALSYFLISFMVLAITSILISMTGTSINDPFIDIMTFFSRYTPVIMVLLVFAAFIRIIFNQVLLLAPVWMRARISAFTESLTLANRDINKKTKVIMLSSFILLSIFIVLIPHLDDQRNRVAEDTVIYAKWIQPLKESKDVTELLRIAFAEIRIATTGDRPISLLLLHSLSSVFDTVLAFEIVLAVLLAPLLTIIMYFLTKELTRDSLASLFCSFITAISFQVMIGMYAGFYANWIALIFGYVSIIFALRYLNTRGKKYLVCLLVTMVMLLFSHVYTWTLITAFLILFLITLRWKKVYDPKSIMFVLSVVVIVFIVDIVRSYLIGLSSGLQSDIVIAQSFDFGFSQLGLAWSNIVRAVEVHQGGIFGNIIILSLAFYYTFLTKYKTITSLFVIVFLSIAILPLLFGDKIIQTRVLYNIPFQLPAALALTSIFYLKPNKIISIAAAVSALAISIYVMSNLGVAPR